MRKLFLSIIIFFLTMLTIFAAQGENSWEPHLKKGTLIKVYPKIPLSTKNLEKGSKVYFIVPQDFWILETKAISKGDIFYGYVSMLKMPVVGVNAAMKINITSIITKDGRRKNVQGKILFKGGSDTLGGNLTNPASYNTTVHPRRVYGADWGGTLQYVPSGEYEHGDHVEVSLKDALFVELEEDYYISY